MNEVLQFIGFFFASFMYVGCVAFQTKVLQHSQHLFVIPISLMISIMNYWVVNNAADNSFWYFMGSAGFGSALGVLCSCLLHDKMMLRKANNNDRG